MIYSSERVPLMHERYTMPGGHPLQPCSPSFFSWFSLWSEFLTPFLHSFSFSLSLSLFLLFSLWCFEILFLRPCFSRSSGITTAGNGVSQTPCDSTFLLPSQKGCPDTRRSCTFMPISRAYLPQGFDHIIEKIGNIFVWFALCILSVKNSKGSNWKWSMGSWVRVHLNH